MSKPTAKRKSLGILLFFFASAALLLAIALENPSSIMGDSSTGIPSLAKQTHQQCAYLRKQLEAQKIPSRFFEMEFNLIDPLPDREEISNLLNSCFDKDIESPLELSAEVFSSAFEGKDGDVIIAQISLSDRNQNKVQEIYLQWKTKNFVPAEPIEENKPTEN